MTQATHWGYDILKQMAAQKCSQQDLTYLKMLFSDEIGAKRRLDRIKSIDDLIACLESKDVISENNVSYFTTMAERCDNKPLRTALDKYHISKIQRQPFNEYQELRLCEQLKQELHINPPSLETSSGSPQSKQNCITTAELSEHKRSAIFKKLSEELGRSWRDLGRRLGLAEGAMDEIEMRFPNDLKSRILRVLQIFEEDECNDRRHLLLLLCRGLSECGRNDLRRKVESIMSH